MKSICSCIFLIFLILNFFTTASNAANNQPCNDPTCLESLSRNDRIKQIADLCPSFSATEGCQQTFMLPPRYNVSAKIAIIGAGMSGILTARKLAQFGYTNITIFEAADSIGGYTQSKKIDGRFYDYQAHLFSSRYWDTRFHPDLTKILQESPFPFREEEFQWRNTTKEILPPCMESIASGLVYPNGSLNGPALAQFIQNIVVTHKHLSDSFWGQVGEGGPGSIRTPNMDLSWPNFKLNFNPVANCIHDTLLNAFQLNLPQLPTAVTVNLNALLQLTLPATVGKLFDKFSSASYSDEWKQFLSQLPSSLRVSLVHSKIFATFTGFNNWIEQISDRLAYALEDSYVIRTGTTVKSLKGGSKVEIEDQRGSTSKFDVAIITTRPRDTRAYVQSPALQALFSEANCPTFWSRSVIVQSESDVHPPACSNNNFGIGLWVLEPWATLSGNDSNAVLNKFTSCDRQNEKNIWVCHASTTQSTTSTDAWRVGKAQLRDYGFGDSERLAEVVSNYPVFPKAQNNFYQSASLLQGVDNIFFGGELMSGPGLESIIDYVYKAIPQWFSIVQEV